MKKIIIPKNIDLEAIIKSCNNQYYNSITNSFERYSKPIDNLDIESAYYILNYILRKTIFKINSKSNTHSYWKSSELIFNDVYVELPSKFLETITRDGKRIMSFLCNQHFNFNSILFRKRYSTSIKNGSPYQYKINYKYINDEYKLIELKHRRLINKLNRINLMGTFINTKFKKLRDDFLFKFDLDISRIKPKIEDDLIKSYYSLFQCFDYYNGSKWMAHHNKTDGRLHTNVTNMSKRHRKFLVNKSGEKLVEIDISSSIPFFVVMLFINPQKALSIKGLLVDQKNMVELILKIFSELISFHPKLYENLIGEINEILNLIINQNFYKNFHYAIDNSNEIRSITKKEILSYFFAKKGEKKEIESVFNSMYPNFHKIMIKIKDTEFCEKHFGYKLKIEANKILSHLLFHIEADIVFKACKTFQTKNSNIPLLTIHDSILVPENNHKELLYVLKNSFVNNYSICPHIKIINY